VADSRDDSGEKCPSECILKQSMAGIMQNSRAGRSELQ
jgi:hypothetical protein